MCGIVGGTNPEWQYADAVEAIAHRGPDSQCVVVENGVSLAFARLAVVDIRDVANQPMSSSCDRYSIVFNGEIYGYRQLRKRMQSEGHRFRTTSDTEVILEAFKKWGDAFIDRLDGMYAMCIFDKHKGELKLYRDRVGIKPLYYFWNGRELAFASELKALQVALAHDSLTIDRTALYDSLTYGYVPAPKSLYRNVFKLPPASHITLDLQTRRLYGPQKYWSLEVDCEGSREISEQDAIEATRALIDESVSEQLVADVPLGCFLSGGIDSSMVVASASRNRDIQTFSVGFEGDQDDETSYARLVATKCETRHVERVLRRIDVDESISNLLRWYDEPFADSSAFPTELVCRVAREFATVALSGDGGDELFGGYRWYRTFRRLRRLSKRAPARLASLFASRRTRLIRKSFVRRLATLGEILTSEQFALYAMLMGGMTREGKRAYAKCFDIPDDYDDYWYFRQYWREDLSILTRLQYLDFHTYLPDDILTKIDRVSMANSLEVRVPLLNRRLVEFAFSLPEPIRFLGDRPKGLLLEAGRGILPDHILQRRKQGFSLPRAYRLNEKQTFSEVVLRDLFGDTLDTSLRGKLPVCDFHSTEAVEL